MFPQPLENSFNSLKKYLENVVYRSDFITEDSLKQLEIAHGAAYIFAQWRLELKQMNIVSQDIDEIHSISIQLLNVSVFKDEKLVYILIRILSEMFFKYSKKYYSIPDVKFTAELYESLKKHNDIKDQNLIKQRYINIWNIYKEASEYIHSNSDTHLSLHDSIKKFIENPIDINFKKSILLYKKLLEEINCLLIIMHSEVYNEMSVPVRNLILGFNNEKVKKEIHNYFFR